MAPTAFFPHHPLKSIDDSGDAADAWAFVGLLPVPSHLLEHSVCGTWAPSLGVEGRGQVTLLLVTRENRL